MDKAVVNTIKILKYVEDGANVNIGEYTYAMSEDYKILVKYLDDYMTLGIDVKDFIELCGRATDKELGIQGAGYTLRRKL